MHGTAHVEEADDVVSKNRCGPSAVAGGRADLRNHGAAYGDARRQHARHAVRGRARSVAVGRNGPDVLADERLPFGAVAEADRQLAKECLRGLTSVNGRALTDYAPDVMVGIAASASCPAWDRQGVVHRDALPDPRGTMMSTAVSNRPWCASVIGMIAFIALL